MVILGGHGQVARALARRDRAGRGVALGHAELDITDAAAVEATLDELRPEESLFQHQLHVDLGIGPIQELDEGIDLRIIPGQVRVGNEDERPVNGSIAHGRPPARRASAARVALLQAV